MGIISTDEALTALEMIGRDSDELFELRSKILDFVIYSNYIISASYYGIVAKQRERMKE